MSAKQIRKLARKRRENARVLKEFLSQYPFITCYDPPFEHRNAWYKFYAFVNDELPTYMTRDSLLESFNKNGLTCMTGSCFNITYEKAFQQFPSEFEKRLPNAKWIGDRSMLFLVDHTISYTPETLEACKLKERHNV